VGGGRDREGHAAPDRGVRGGGVAAPCIGRGSAPCVERRDRGRRGPPTHLGGAPLATRRAAGALRPRRTVAAGERRPGSGGPARVSDGERSGAGSGRCGAGLVGTSAAAPGDPARQRSDRSARPGRSAAGGRPARGRRALVARPAAPARRPVGAGRYRRPRTSAGRHLGAEAGRGTRLAARQHRLDAAPVRGRGPPGAGPGARAPHE
jgi:hypothetical protein